MNIIELAREAGLLPCHEIYEADLQAFAAAVIAAHTAELLKDVGEPALPKGVGWSASFTIDYYTAAQVAAAVAKAKQDEDAPAKVVLQQMKRIATLESVLKAALEALIYHQSLVHPPTTVIAIEKCKEVLNAE